ncbi:MAG: glycosyltransferase [Lentimicrobiaceae bacterium]|nr:glycosyltransferase [Lentimicrobiaceae bacterium]
MKIFVLLPRIPWPLEKGDKLRAYNQIKQLSNDNEVVLCALNTDKNANKEEAYKALQPYCISVTFIDINKISILFNIIKAFLKGLPIQCGYFYNSKAHKIVHNLIEKNKPDMLFGQLLRVAEYLRFEKTAKTIDYQDVFSMGMKRRADIAPFYLKPVFNMEYNRLRRYEHDIFDDFDVKTIISIQDRDDIDHTKKEEILIVPNGVDHEYYSPQQQEKKYDIVFTGNMAYAPNVNAVEYLSNHILPLVWEKLPNTKMYIAGATPDPRVKKVASERIIISGWLDDMRDAYAQSKIFIAPMRIGTGLQNKLLEAMSMRLPCITTSLANGSLHAEDGKEILVGDNEQELAKHIITLLTDKEKAESVAQNGYDFVHRVYDWGEATKIMENEMKLKIK